MKKIILTVIFQIFGMITIISAQEKVNNPVAIMQFIEKSPIMYDIVELNDSVLPPDRSKNVLENKYRRIVDGEDYFVIEYDSEIYNDVLYINALGDFNKDNFESAYNGFAKILEKYPDFYVALTYQAKCLIKLKKEDDAIDKLRSAISSNYIDFEAHALLAGLYSDLDMIDAAVKYITVAHILNRNNPLINTKRIEIYKKKGLKTPDWVFVPQVKYESSKSSVKILTKTQFTGWAWVESLWQFDTDYRKTKQNPDARFNLNKYHECVMYHSVALQKVPWYVNTDEGKSFKTALEKRIVNEFLYYEIILADYPDEALKLKEDKINRLVDYVLTVRGEQQ